MGSKVILFALFLITICLLLTGLDFAKSPNESDGHHILFFILMLTIFSFLYFKQRKKESNNSD